MEEQYTCSNNSQTQNHPPNRGTVISESKKKQNKTRHDFWPQWKFSFVNRSQKSQMIPSTTVEEEGRRCNHVHVVITHTCCTMARLTPAASDVPSKPYQPVTLSYPKCTFGQQNIHVVHHSFQSSWLCSGLPPLPFTDIYYRSQSLRSQLAEHYCHYTGFRLLSRPTFGTQWRLVALKCQQAAAQPFCWCVKATGLHQVPNVDLKSNLKSVKRQ